MPQSERSFRSEALILKRRDFDEADRLLTILTPQHGKRSAIAKGARKPTSSKTGHVELFTAADMLINRGRDLDIIVQAQMIAPFLPLREDLARGAYASYAAELMDRFTFEGDDTLEEHYELLYAVFEHLCQVDDLRLAVRYYEIHLLDAAGFRPELTHCVFSHEEIQPEDQFFSYAEGGVVSPTAARHATALVDLSLTALKVMRHMQRSSFAQIRALEIAPALHAELERVLLGYITFLLERRLQSVDFIRRIRS